MQSRLLSAILVVYCVAALELGGAGNDEFAPFPWTQTDSWMEPASMYSVVVWLS